MKKLFTTLSVAIITYTAFAQQDPQFSQYMYNRLFTNPGYAGSNDGICANLIGRTQWTGFDGAPKTAVLAIDATVTKIHGGVGLVVMQDKIGFQSTLAARLAYAYRMNVGSGKLGIGVDIGILNQSMNGEFVAIQSGDPSIPTGKSSDLIPDLGAGVYYNTDKLYFGISASHLMGGKLELDNMNSEPLNVARHYYATAGYDYVINPNFTLRPSVFIKSDAASTQLDINLNLLIKEMIWVGASYRIDDAVVAHAGAQFGGFKFGYAYDFTTSKLGGYSNGTHELFLGYCFKFNKPGVSSKYRNVRFL